MLNSPAWASALSADGLRIFALDHPHVARTLYGRLKKRQEELVVQNGIGLAEDFADYRHRAGVIHGLQEAIDLCEQTNKELGD